MSSSNPYQAPQSDVASNSSTYQPQFFSTKGRIGRLRYLAYSVGAYFLTYIPMAAIMGIAYSIGDSGSMNPLLISIPMGIVGIIMFVFFIIITKRRLNDLNRTGWLSLLFIIPLVNIVIWIYTVFFSGTKGNNNYGPMPTKNPPFMWVAAILPIIAIIGILAAVALPAYQDYVIRAQEAAQSLPVK